MTSGLKVPCDQRFNDVSQGYAILDSTSEMICETSLSTRTASEYILKKTLTNEGFCYDLYDKSASQKSICIITYVFFNSKKETFN